MRSFLCFLLCALAVVSCDSKRACDSHDQLKNWMSENGKLKVLATLTMIEDLVKQVGGEYVDTISLISGELDPHSYQLVKGDDEKLLNAQLIFYNGLGLEHGPSFQRYLNDSKAIGLGDLLNVSDPSAILYVDGRPDPHIWMDISLWAKGIDVIVEKLSEQLPKRRDYFKLRGNAYRKEMLAKHDQVHKLLQKIPEDRRYLVTSHDAFNYFTRAYLAAPGEKTILEWGKRFAAPEGLAPESQLSTTDIQKIIEISCGSIISRKQCQSRFDPQDRQCGARKGITIDHLGQIPVC
jgi:manganese/zinc/iron transport system substrate-binding protein